MSVGAAITSFAQFAPVHGEAVARRLPQAKAGHAVAVNWSGYRDHSAVSFTAMRGDQPIACAGVIPAWPGRGVAWCIFAEGMRGAMIVAIHRHMAAGLWDCHTRLGMRRIEMGVHTSYVDGHRWARMLGFKREGTMRLYSPDGTDTDLYARIMET
jgi:hypothetical protein